MENFKILNFMMSGPGIQKVNIFGSKGFEETQIRFAEESPNYSP